MLIKKTSIAILSVIAISATSCSDNALSPSVDVRPLTPVDSTVPAGTAAPSSSATTSFIPPPIPEWVNERTFPDLKVTADTQSDLFLEALELHKDRDYDSAYSIFHALANSDVKVAHVYLGIIESEPGPLHYPRGALTHQYEALDSGGHATSLSVLARGLSVGESIQVDPVGSLQYYARLIPALPSDHALVDEANSAINTADSTTLSEALLRERSVLDTDNIDYAPSDDLVTLAAAVVQATVSHKAPGTEYLSNYPR